MIKIHNFRGDPTTISAKKSFIALNRQEKATGALERISFRKQGIYGLYEINYKKKLFQGEASDISAECY